MLDDPLWTVEVLDDPFWIVEDNADVIVPAGKPDVPVQYRLMVLVGDGPQLVC